jgi:excisionase family DNA binding protein
MSNEAIPPTKVWVTARQIAVRYRVTKPTVFNWLRAGIIPAELAVGRIYRFDLDEVDHALKSRSRISASSSRQNSGRCADDSKHGRAER